MSDQQVLGARTPVQRHARTEAVELLEASIVRRRRLVLLTQILVGVVFLLFWEWASGRLIDPLFISRPSRVFVELWEWAASGELTYHLAATLQAAVLGFAIGATSGFVLGLLFGRFRFVADVSDPYMTALYSLPKIALAPLFIIWFGVGIASKIAVSAIIVFLFVFINTFSGVREVNPVYLHAARIMGASEWALIRTVMLPSATTWVIAGLKISIPYAIVGAVVGEFISASRGIGYVLAQATGLYNTTLVFAGLIVLAVVGIIVNAALKLFERWALSWRE